MEKLNYKQCFTYIVKGIVGIFAITIKVIITDIKRHKSLVTAILLFVSIICNILQMVYNKPRIDAHDEKILKLRDSLNNRVQNIYDIGYMDSRKGNYNPYKLMNK